MEIVPTSKIPKFEDIKDVDLDNPIKIYNICLQMKDICKKEKGIGLSAVQVGIPIKLFILKDDNEEYEYYANCEYTPSEESQIDSLEGCLSIKSLDNKQRHFQVKRYEKVFVEGFVLSNLKFRRFEKTLSVYERGIVFQHEIDHHRGVLISDIGTEHFIW